MKYDRISNEELNRQFSEIDDNPDHMKYWSRRHKQEAILQAPMMAAMVRSIGMRGLKREGRADEM